MIGGEKRVLKCALLTSEHTLLHDSKPMDTSKVKSALSNLNFTDKYGNKRSLTGPRELRHIMIVFGRRYIQSHEDDLEELAIGINDAFDT